MTLTLEHLSTGYSGSKVLNEVNLQVHPGEVVALLGRNGMGKSTLARTVAGSHQIESGRILLMDQVANSLSPRKRFQLGLRTMRQERPVLDGLTVRENLKLAGTTLDSASTIFSFLTERADQDAGTLSGGEQKMLALARIYGNPGKIWVLDEPTEGLQPSNVHLSGEIVKTAAQNGCGILLIEQHISLALSVAHRWLVLEKGVIVDHGTVDESSLLRITKRLAV